MSYLNPKEAVEQSSAVATLVGALFTAESSTATGILEVRADLVKAIREQIKPLLAHDKASSAT